jgi:hypothetical protein
MDAMDAEIDAIAPVSCNNCNIRIAPKMIIRMSTALANPLSVAAASHDKGMSQPMLAIKTAVIHPIGIALTAGQEKNTIRVPTRTNGTAAIMPVKNSTESSPAIL